MIFLSSLISAHDSPKAALCLPVPLECRRERKENDLDFSPTRSPSFRQATQSSKFLSRVYLTIIQCPNPNLQLFPAKIGAELESKELPPSQSLLDLQPTPPLLPFPSFPSSNNTMDDDDDIGWFFPLLPTLANPSSPFPFSLSCHPSSTTSATSSSRRRSRRRTVFSWTSPFSRRRRRWGRRKGWRAAFSGGAAAEAAC